MMPTTRPRSRLTLLIAVFVLSTGAGALPMPGAQAQDGNETVAEPGPPSEGRRPGPQDLRLQGNVTHAETGEPLTGVEIDIFNRWISEQDGERSVKGYHETTTTTGPNGSYKVNVSRGHVQLSIDDPAYQRLHATFEIQGNLTLDLEMRPVDGELATLSGQVTDTQGQPIADASLNVRPVQQHHCDGDVCYAHETARASEGGDHETVVHADGEAIEIRYEPRDRRYANTQTGEDGTYSVRVPAGDYVVRAWARDHVEAEDEVTLREGEHATLDLALTAIPPSSVTVEGQIVDADTGEPIPYADVMVENDRWGDWNHARTDEDGRFSVRTKPGYILVTARAERTYWVPCQAPDAPTASTEGDEIASHPARRCDGRQEREHGYLSRVATFSPAAGETVQADASLKRAPAPDATFSGWVINASSEEGIPNATVGFHNELTNEWGRAETDANGSFTIDVRAGYYTIRVHHPEHLSTAMNAEIASGEAQRITLEVPPGQPARGGCCIAYAEPARDTAASMDADGGGASDETGNAPTASGASGSQAAPEGREVFEGSGGGLGPYVASHTDGAPGSEASTPLVSMIGTLVMIGLGAAALKLYHPEDR